ncbi:MAG: diaminopimelate epimerase [Armatimonadetes bacterium]|nr:diaminopimelate epimerase [Armatimonadota bacterium]
MNFSKIEGLGNDFILVEEKDIPSFGLSPLIRKICDRHFGIGADGLIVIFPSDKAHLKIKIFNADGTEAQMSGNGIRCVAKYAYEKGLVIEKKINIETQSGIITPLIFTENGEINEIEVDMGKPELSPSKIPVNFSIDAPILNYPLKIKDKTFFISCVSMGNPHCVIFKENLEEVMLEELGPLIENHPIFPERVNIEFIKVLNPDHLVMLVWERGVGPTLACGTGACAGLVAGVLNKKCNREVVIDLTGGTLKVSWRENNHLYLKGRVKKVFEGKYLI